MRIKLFVLLLVIFSGAAFYATNRSEGKVEATGKGERVIVVTLNDPDRSVLEEGDRLCARTQFMIGRIYLSFLHDYTDARGAFEKVLADYPDTRIAQYPYLKKE